MHSVLIADFFLEKRTHLLGNRFLYDLDLLVGFLLPIIDHLSHLFEKFSDTFLVLLLSVIYLYLFFLTPFLSYHLLSLKAFDIA